MAVVAEIHLETNLSEFTATSGADISWSNNATAKAVAGTQGAAAILIDDVTDDYGYKDFSQSAIIRYRLYIDPNTLTMANGANFLFSFLGQAGGVYAWLTYLHLVYTTATDYALRLRYMDDAYSEYSEADVLITDTPHYIEVKEVQATGAGTSDGTIQWWVDGVDKGTITGLDNYNLMLDYGFRLLLGARTFTGGTPSGTIYLDEAVANNDGGVIGPVGGEGLVASGITCLWPSTNASIPTGWTRVTALDALYSKGAAAAANPGGTGGNNTHPHSTSNHNHSANHVHTVPDSPAGSGSTTRDAGTVRPPVAHTHVSNPNTTNPTSSLLANDNPSTDSPNNEPPYFAVIHIQSTGAPDGLPNNGIALWNNPAGAPTNWNLADGGSGRPDLRGKFLKGAAGGGGDGGGTGGNLTHSHTIASHTHGTNFSHNHPTVNSSATAASMVGGPVSGANVGTATQAHFHVLTIGNQATDAITGNTDPTGTGSNEPPYVLQAFIQNNTGAESLPAGIICIWTGLLANIPSGWNLCDGSLSTPDLRSQFIKGATTLAGIGGTGGSLTHTHTATGHTHAVASHAHTVAAAAGAGSNETAGAVNCATTAHTHPSWTDTGAQSFTSGTGTPTVTDYTGTQPTYYTVAFVQKASASTPMTLTGASTPTGTLVKSIGQSKTGDSTPTGMLSRTFIRIGYLLGSITPSGVLNYSKSRLMTLVGEMTPAGTLVRSIDKGISGALTFIGEESHEFIAGAHQTLMTLTGAITPGGTLDRVFIRIGYLVGSITPSGVLNYYKGRAMTLIGGITPGGTLVNSIGKTITGGLSSAGNLTRSLAKALAGGSTPSGILTSYKAKVMLLVGSLASSGVLIKSSLRSLAGGITPGGVLSRVVTVYRTLIGGATPGGVLTYIKAKAVTFVGGITPTGTLGRVLNLARTITGSVAAAGTLAKSLGRSLAGGMTPAGVVVKSIWQAKAGAITMAGTLGKSFHKLLAGWIASTGIFARGGSITESWWRDKDDIHTHEAVTVGVVRDAADILPVETPAAGWLRDKDDIHIHEAVGAGLLRDHADIEEES